MKLKKKIKTHSNWVCFFYYIEKNIKIIIFLLLLSCHFATSTLQNKIKLNKNVFFCQIILLYEKKVVPLHRQTKKKRKKNNI